MDIELTRMSDKDLELVRGWRNSEDVSKYMYSTQRITQDEQKAWFKKVKDDFNSRYWIITHDSKRLGVASLNNINENLSSCYWAFYLGDTSVRGKGIGAKVEYNVLRYVFDDLNLNKLRCEVLASNSKVVAMHEKFGFRREAYYREHVNKDGTFHDVVGLAILKKEWKLIEPLMKVKIYG